MKKSIRGLLITAAAAAFVSAQAATASAATIRPASFDECGTASASGIYNCMYVDGGGDVAYEVRGWSHATNAALYGLSVHEEVVSPSGSAFCNSATVTLANTGQVVGCQVSYGSTGADIQVGRYCAILWAYVHGPVGISGQDGWYYANEAENCGTVSS